MGFMDAVKLFFARYTDFNGRSRRSEYWWPVLFHTLVYVVALLLSVVLGSISELLGAIVGIALLIYYVAILIPSLAVGVRRLHDRDMSGWWLLLGFVPFAGFVLLVFFVLEGTNGPNKFGPDPKNPAGGTADVFS